LLLPHAGILAALVFAVPVRAQQPAPSAAPPETPGQQPLPSRPPSPSGQPEKAKAPDTATKGQQTGTSNERLFWALPDFLLIEKAGTLPPLSVGGKFKVVARNSFDRVNYPVYGVLAGIGQAENSEKGYGQGAKGYAKRYSATFADTTIENFMTSAVLTSILHQDPRFYQLGTGGFWRRARYGVRCIFVTRADSGKAQFNYSEIFGGAIAAGISTYSYHPRSDRSVRNALSVWGTQVGLDTITGIFNEFWPDIHHHFAKK
jgi:hypothetical protein